MRLGASRVFSFDRDAVSVECARELKRRYYPDDHRWEITRGDVLDRAFLHSLGQWDIVYSWGVLHHADDMWSAMAAVQELVGSTGRLLVAIYNDQGARSRAWKRVKAFHNSGRLPRAVVRGMFLPYFSSHALLVDLARGRNPLRRYREYREARGMSQFHDWLDWLGGYPFDVARPEEVFQFYRARGFTLEGMRTAVGGSGCNEILLQRAQPPPARG
jgi:2-polyprenyl-6-hydroxyphenyl methylase/3-demethylubiquinone-9 3-methyltransferase